MSHSATAAVLICIICIVSSSIILSIVAFTVQPLHRLVRAPFLPSYSSFNLPKRFLKMSARHTSLSLQDFVQSYQSSFQTSLAHKNVHLFLGNRAADADSVFSALTCAYSRWRSHREKVQHDGTANEVDIFLPLSFVSALDLPLRAELKLLLAKVGLFPRDLLLTEQLLAKRESLQLDKANKVEITLLDHNALDAQFLTSLSSSARPTVVQIIDHHSDNGAHRDTVTDAQRVVAFDETEQKALVGSCCTLIFEELQREQEQDILSTVALPLLGVILLDTLNMDSAAAKGTERDRLAVSALQRILDLDEHAANALYRELCNAKTDPALWESLSVSEALRFDYKAEHIGCGVNMVGFSSVLLPMSKFVEKTAFWDSLAQYFSEQQLQSLVVMSLVQEPTPHRELLVVEKKTDAASLTHYLQSVESLQLQPLSLSFPLSSSDFASEHTIADFTQGNVKMSRKQVLPLVKQFYQQS